MTPYSSRSGKPSGVSAYRIGKDFIEILFQSDQYKYSYASCGKATVDEMKKLAVASQGLSTFISRYHPAYEWKK